ncbi:GFA family protein [Aestuariirhabdus sp. LZHN29]|uniref:GFA family protein n=1 Tax=Aestuariirhabdus sp. LZHN29 TaxID=3417462 RepID=UPI003CE72B73
MEVDCGSEIRFEGGDQIARYDSSEWAQRGFCRCCGSHLFYYLKQANQYMVPVGLFENDEGLVFEQQVFIDEKPAYYHFSNITEEMTGAELFASFAPPE